MVAQQLVSCKNVDLYTSIPGSLSFGTFQRGVTFLPQIWSVFSPWDKHFHTNSPTLGLFLKISKQLNKKIILTSLNIRDLNINGNLFLPFESLQLSYRSSLNVGELNIEKKGNRKPYCIEIHQLQYFQLQQVARKYMRAT